MAKVRTPDGEIIERVLKAKKLGNWVNLYVRWNNEDWWVGNGDEYLRGYPEVFEITGKKGGE